jgi:hypothetical protein
VLQGLINTFFCIILVLAVRYFILDTSLFRGAKLTQGVPAPATMSGMLASVVELWGTILAAPF